MSVFGEHLLGDAERRQAEQVGVVVCGGVARVWVRGGGSRAGRRRADGRLGGRGRGIPAVGGERGLQVGDLGLEGGDLGQAVLVGGADGLVLALQRVELLLRALVLRALRLVGLLVGLGGFGGGRGGGRGGGAGEGSRRRRRRVGGGGGGRELGRVHGLGEGLELVVLAE